ncbi:OmpA family protein [Proteiniborus sp.]|uniref:OmpA/MotB family protein n=1 Tax=Proteiniborus sp. TaxID=2079015 RepID=UPI003323454C
MYDDKDLPNQHDEESTTDYWISYSDMMSSLLLMFILFLTVSIFNFNDTSFKLEKQSQVLEVQGKELMTQKEKINSIIGVRKQIINALRDEFKNSKLKIDIDPQTGAITFSSGVFFDSSESSLKESGKKYLNEFIPLYFGVLLNEKNRDYISEIIIEGHTDTNGTYMYNLSLSQERAFEVTKYILGEEGCSFSDNKEELRRILTANGRSFSNPIFDKNGNVDMDRSRRVEFKFRLKDDEMIDEMKNILEGVNNGD